MQYDEEYFNSEDFHELLDSYEAAVANGGHAFMDADDLVDIADYYNMAGEYDKAVEAVDYAIQLYPNATLPNVFKAREALQNADYDTALQYADNIEQKDDPDYHYLKAEILLAQGHIDESDRYLRDYGMTVPADEYQDFVKDCANLYVDYGISDKAYEWMMRSKGDNSDDFKELMARTLFGLGKYKDSERIFNELIDHNPFSKHYWNALASVQFMNEEYNDSITSSEYAIAIDPNDPDGLFSKANGLFRLGNYEEALDYYQRYSKILPDDEQCLLHQGTCLVNLGRPQEAIAILEEAIAVAPPGSPFLPQIYQEQAFCYSALKDIQKALAALDNTLTLECDHIDMLVIRGHILLENGLIKEAEEAFKKAVVQSDNAPSVLLRVIVSLYDNRYVNASYLMFKKYFQLVNTYDPAFKDGYAYMALCCYDLGRTDEFMKYLRKAVKHNPHETRSVLGFIFPEDMAVEDYYGYMEEKLKN